MPKPGKTKKRREGKERASDKSHILSVGSSPAAMNCTERTSTITSARHSSARSRTAPLIHLARSFAWGATRYTGGCSACYSEHSHAHITSTAATCVSLWVRMQIFQAISARRLPPLSHSLLPSTALAVTYQVRNSASDSPHSKFGTGLRGLQGAGTLQR